MLLQTTAPWSRTVSHSTSHSPGEELQACQENKHVWHSTNQAIMVSIRGLRMQPKGSTNAELRPSPSQFVQNRYPRNTDHPLSPIICAAELPLTEDL